MQKWSELPLILTPKMIFEREIFPGSRNAVYRLFHRNDFPAVRLGGKLVVSRDAFRSWIESGGQAVSVTR